MRVAELWTSFGFKVDRGSMSSVNRAIGVVRRSMLGLGAAFAGGSLMRASVALNSEMEQLKLQIAGMLSLSKKSDLTTELATANDLVGRLRDRSPARTCRGTSRHGHRIRALYGSRDPASDRGGDER